MSDAVSEATRSLDRGVARRHAFLEAARAVFLESGYEAASVNEVVRRAGGSLATLYAQFGNKEGLFLAVAADQHERFARAISAACDPDLPLEQGLQAMGEQFLKVLLGKDNVAFYRIVVGEGRKFPQLMQKFTSGYTNVRDMVVNYLSIRAEREGVEFDNPEAAASYFFDAVRARNHYKAMADQDFELPPQELAKHVQMTVKYFLHGTLRRGS